MIADENQCVSAVDGGDRQDYLFACGYPRTFKQKGDDMVITIDHDTQVVCSAFPRRNSMPAILDLSHAAFLLIAGNRVASSRLSAPV
jgi:hypothetical protein